MEAHKWNKNDKITATRLNTMSDAINSLLKQTCAPVSDKGRATGYTDNEGPSAPQNKPMLYDHDTFVVWRHPWWGTADIMGGEGKQNVGFYATPPRVQRADGTDGCLPVWSGCHPAPCKICFDPSGTSDTVYLKVVTTNTGKPTEVEYTTKVGTKNLYHLKGGNGTLFYPVAQILPNPQFPCEQLVMNSHAVNLPFITADASYIPCVPAGQRQVQGMAFADPLREAVIPIEGLNNHGGVKVLDGDHSGVLASQAVMASIEMYGVAPGSQQPGGDKTYPYCIPLPPSTKDATHPSDSEEDEEEESEEDTGEESTHRKGWLYQPYNKCTPYKDSGDGLLAWWRILDGNGECTGRLELQGQHLEDWQLAFQGTGEIRMPNVPSYYGANAWTEDYKYEFGGGKEGDKSYLIIEEYSRQECFYKLGHTFYDRWTPWCLVSSKRIELGGGSACACNSHTEDHKYEFSSHICGGFGRLEITEYERQECFGQVGNGAIYDKWSDWTPSGTHQIDLGLVGTPALTIHTLSGTHASSCISHWCGFHLHLVQEPIYNTAFTCGPLGFKLV